MAGTGGTRPLVGASLRRRPVYSSWKELAIDSRGRIVVLLFLERLGEEGYEVMERNLVQLIDEVSELAQKVAERRNEILKFQTSDFIRSFVELTRAIEHLDSSRELLLGRAETLLSRPRETERKLRKEHLMVISGKNQ
jgi:hypothetical protein